MKKKLIAMILCALMIISVLPASVLALDTGDIVILYENDVHCEVEGYSKLAAMKKELQETYAHVGVVSGGDCMQPESSSASSMKNAINFFICVLPQ